MTQPVKPNAKVRRLFRQYRSSPHFISIKEMMSKLGITDYHRFNYLYRKSHIMDIQDENIEA